MQLHGSCHCGAVQFDVAAAHPLPYMHCYCGVCRKTAGGGGYAINIGAQFATLEVTGAEHVEVYRATIQNPEEAAPRRSQHERSFCAQCGSHLWAWHPKWPDLVHPLASAIDTPLPVPPERTHIMLEFKASWVEPQVGANDIKADRYPSESIAAWHERLGLSD